MLCTFTPVLKSCVGEDSSVDDHVDFKLIFLNLIYGNRGGLNCTLRQKNICWIITEFFNSSLWLSPMYLIE